MPERKPKDKDTTPEALKPYVFHGLDLTWGGSDTQAVCDCPFCGKEGKFYVSLEKGLSQCWACQIGNGKGGMNSTLFLRELWRTAFDQTPVEEYKTLAKERKILFSDTLIQWNLAMSPTTGDWLIPGYGLNGEIQQLYRYLPIKDKNGEWKRKLIPTPTHKHAIFGFHLFDKSKDVIDLCEGPWDGAAWWEVLSHAKEFDGDLTSTSNVKASLLADVNVIAIPGCNSFNEAWSELFSKKIVRIFFDNDYPKPQQGKKEMLAPAGYRGAKKVAQTLASSKKPPQEIQFIKWGEEGYDPNLPEGFDVRDQLCQNA